MTTGRWVYRLGRCRVDGFVALLGMLTEAFPAAIVVICDHDSIRHAREVTRCLVDA